jgi:hypothetical protein
MLSVAGVIVILRLAVAESLAASVTWIVKLDAPSVVGVPEIVTELLVLEPSERPVGRLPVVRLHEKGPLPPLALITALRAMP